MTSRGIHACILCAPPCRLHTMDTYNDDIMHDDCLYLGQSDNCYQFKTSVLLMYSRGDIPKDSLQPNDVMMSMWYLFAWPHPHQPISNQFSVWATPPADCKNHRTHHVFFILTLTSRKTTSTTLNHSLHLHASNKMLSTTHVSLHVIIHSIQGKFVHLSSVHINLSIPHCLLLY